MIYFFVLVLILSVFLTGVSILHFLLPKNSINRFLLLGLGFGVGSLFIIIEMFLFSLLAIPMTRETALLPWFMWVLVFISQVKLSGLPSTRLKIPESLIEKMLILLTISLVVFVGLEAVVRLPMGWDAIATWLLQAKGFYYQGGLKTDIYHYAQIDSPPGLGLLLLFFYTVLGGVFDRAVLLLFSAFYLAILFTLFGSIRQFTNHRTAILFVFLFATTQSVIRQAGRFDAGYADLPLSYFFLCSAVLLQYFKKTNKSMFILVAGVFAGIGSFIKNEGSAFFLAVSFVTIFAVLSAKKVKKSNLMYFLPGSLIFFSWQVYKLFFPLHPSYYSQGHLVVERIWMVSIGMFLEFFRIDRWNFLWLFLLLCIVVVRKKIFFSIPFQLLVLQFGVYFLIYMFTPLDPIGHISGSFDRLLLHLAPLAMLYIALISYDILSKPVKTHAKKSKIQRRFDIGNSGRSKKL